MSSKNGRAAECPVSMPVGRVGAIDPPPELQRLAEEQPICRVRLLNGESGWLVTSYELGRTLLADRRFSAGRIWGRQPIGDLDRWLAEGILEEGAVPFINETDPPDHTRRRRAVMSRLTFNHVQSTRERVQAIIDEAVDALEQEGPPTDFMELFARPVPALVLSDILGVPGEDRAVFVELTDRIRDPGVSPDDMVGDILAFYEYVERLVADKSAALGDDLLSDMIRGGSMTHDEIVKDAIGMLQAGHETTTTQFGYGLFTLLSDRSRWQALVAAPESVDRVVEEMLRYHTIIDANPTERTALEDVELGGVMILAGETVVVSLFAGNRDAERFPDPDLFLPDRDARGHLAFGGGIHLCAGQHVARLELTLGFTSLARRFPDLRLAAEPDDIRWLPDHHQMSGPLTLPVTW
ncbi:MAG TPA: cytochrome P450 [Nocardioides sp.]|nr:cytochrome P450 [Nocardioides sp.]